MRDSEEQLARWHADDDIVHKLDEVSGIGLLTASALKTAVGKPERFASDCTGSSRAARRAGNTPNRIPVTSAVPSPASTAQSGG